MTAPQSLIFEPDACFYSGRVSHVRHGQPNHKLVYGVTALLLPLDDLQSISKRSRLFSVNRFNLLSFHESDHMEKGHENLTAYIRYILSVSGKFDKPDQLPDRITLLAYPRLLGHAFNPLSIFFCCDEQDRLQAILYQVNNTFGQRQHYLYRLSDDELSTSTNGRLRHEGKKIFYVSPFLPIKGGYHFSMKPPAERFSFQIALSGDVPSTLTAIFAAKRLPFSSSTILQTIVKAGQTGWKILAAIHFEALKLWLKGAPFYKRPKTYPFTVASLHRSTFNKESLENDIAP